MTTLRQGTNDFYRFLQLFSHTYPKFDITIVEILFHRDWDLQNELTVITFIVLLIICRGRWLKILQGQKFVKLALLKEVLKLLEFRCK